MQYFGSFSEIKIVFRQVQKKFMALISTLMHIDVSMYEKYEMYDDFSFRTAQLLIPYNDVHMGPFCTSLRKTACILRTFIFELP